MAKPIKLHWSRSKPNFGDALSPLICEAVSGRKVVHAKPSQADLIAIGSLLQRLKERWFSHRIHVWGTGLIEDRHPRPSRHFYHAVRGKLSQQALCQKSPLALGDPGLLADMLIPPVENSQKKYKVGFIEHYKDKNHPLITQLNNTFTNTTVIDIFSPPIDFLNKIAECEVIFSSAMHGLIAADSLGIPNAWLKLSNQVKGQDFKFKDYYSNFGLAASPVVLHTKNLNSVTENIVNEYRRNNIDHIKAQLYKAFPKEL